jgi:hypothetical protein
MTDTIETHKSDTAVTLAVVDTLMGDINQHKQRIATLEAAAEKMAGALEETTALCYNYHAVEEIDGYRFEEAPAVISIGNEALQEYRKLKEGK